MVREPVDGARRSSDVSGHALCAASCRAVANGRRFQDVRARSRPASTMIFNQRKAMAF
jgi:hypothetical protein